MVTTGDRPSWLAYLRDVLAALYPEPEEARRVIDDSGLPAIHFRFVGAPITMWHGILRGAFNRDPQRFTAVAAIVRIALQEYAQHPCLSEVQSIVSRATGPGHRKSAAPVQHAQYLEMPGKPPADTAYLLYPPFFRALPGELSFAEGWEVFCCQLLNLHERTTAIRRRRAPEGGIDLIWQERGMAYQCKSVASGQTGDFDPTKAVASIAAAMAHRTETGWRRYHVCTNVELTGPQERKLRKVLPRVQLLTPSFWVPRCREHHEDVYGRFCVPDSMKRADSGAATSP